MSELQSMLQEALRAQSYEDDGEVELSLESYFKSACQLNYFADCHGGTDMGQLCQGLSQLFQQRMLVLRGRQEGRGPQWLQLEQVAPFPGAHGPSQLTASGATSTALGSHTSGRMLPLRMDQTQQHAVFAAASAGGGGLEQVLSDPATPGSNSQLDLLHTCQKTVSGSLDDVVGLENVKLELEEAVFMPLELPHLFKGIRQPARTFLLYGPPGTGKTLLVEKVAAEAGFMLLSLSPSMILSKWAGDSEKAISGVFDLAKSLQPCIIFLDEVDSLGQSRGNSTDAGARRLLTELLIQFTRAAGEEGVYVFGATNRMQDCDPALLRRFSRRIEVPLPDDAARECFFQSVLSRPEVTCSLSTDEINQLVQLTQGYSGSDLTDLCRTAALAPVRELMLQQRQQLGRKRRRVGMDVLSSVYAGSRQSEESCIAGDSPPDSTCGTDSLMPVQHAGAVLQDASTGAAGSAQDIADRSTAVATASNRSGQVQLRALVLSDFQAALELVKPAAMDAGLTD